MKLDTRQEPYLILYTLNKNMIFEVKVELCVLASCWLAKYHVFTQRVKIMSSDQLHKPYKEYKIESKANMDISKPKMKFSD